MKKMLFIFFCTLCLFSSPVSSSTTITNSPHVLYLVGPVSEDSAALLVAQLRKIDQTFPGEEVEIHITSPGGSVYAGLAVYDAMQEVSLKIKTVCEGYCMSMGALILAAGDVREAGENATILVHQVSYSRSASSSLGALSNELKEVTRLQNVVDEILSKHTGLSRKKIKEIQSYDHYMSSKDALKLGIIDRISTSKKFNTRISAPLNP